MGVFKSLIKDCLQQLTRFRYSFQLSTLHGQWTGHVGGFLFLQNSGLSILLLCLCNLERNQCFSGSMENSLVLYVGPGVVFPATILLVHPHVQRGHQNDQNKGQK